MVKISIIVPIYNSEEFLSECISSIIKQTYKNTEIILVNDGATDNSLEICNKFQFEDDRIKIISQKNSGVSNARNTGIKAANGEYFTFVDSDDLIDLDYCQILLDSMEINKVDMVYFGQATLNGDSSDLIFPRLEKGIYKTEDLLSSMLDDGTLRGFLLHSSCAVLYKTSIVQNNNISFDSNLQYNEDGFFNLLYCLHIDQLYVNQQASIYSYRINLNSATHKGINIEDKYRRLHEKIIELDKRYPDYDFNQQLSIRKLTIIFEELVNPLTLKDKNRWMRTAKRLVTPLSEEYFYNFNVEKMSRSRKEIFKLLKQKNFVFLFIILKYIRPLAKQIKVTDM